MERKVIIPKQIYKELLILSRKNIERAGILTYIKQERFGKIICYVKAIGLIDEPKKATATESHISLNKLETYYIWVKKKPDKRGVILFHTHPLGTLRNSIADKSFYYNQIKIYAEFIGLTVIKKSRGTIIIVTSEDKLNYSDFKIV